MYDERGRFRIARRREALHRLSERVVLINHADLMNSQHIPKIVHLLTGLIVIRRADVHYIMLQRRVEHFCAGKEPDHRNFIRFRQRDVLGGRLCTDKKSRAKNAFLLQTLEAVFRVSGLIAVVEGETRGPKIRVFKKKRRKGMRRTNGHRAFYTRVRITDILL